MRAPKKRRTLYRCAVFLGEAREFAADAIVTFRGLARAFENECLRSMIGGVISRSTCRLGKVVGEDDPGLL